jgi:myosin heavy subunit
MSPIGRVFIVLNLILAGTFVGFSGTFLQRQFHWKTEHGKVTTELNQLRETTSVQIADLEKKISEMSTSLRSTEQDLGSTRTERDNAKDEVKRLEASHASKDADLKKLASEVAGIKTNADAAFQQSTAAYQASIAAQKEKDDAVNAMNASSAENRDLKNQIAALNEAGSNKDLAIAGLNKDKGELRLLVDVAKAKGFLESMAVPQLAGTVSVVNGNLCTVMITANPTNAEIKSGYALAIYDGGVYKGEARITGVDAERNAAFCRLDVKSGEVKVGDKASTHLGGL